MIYETNVYDTLLVFMLPQSGDKKEEEQEPADNNDDDDVDDDDADDDDDDIILNVHFFKQNLELYER